MMMKADSILTCELSCGYININVKWLNKIVFPVPQVDEVRINLKTGPFPFKHLKRRISNG